MYQFDRETLLDLVVNAVPLVILAFFILLFVVVNPFNADPVATALQLTIVGVTLLALLVLTYYSGKAISEAEEELEANRDAFAEPQAAAADPETTAPDDEEVEETAEDNPEELTPAVTPLDAE